MMTEIKTVISSKTKLFIAVTLVSLGGFAMVANMSLQQYERSKVAEYAKQYLPRVDSQIMMELVSTRDLGDVKSRGVAIANALNQALSKDSSERTQGIKLLRELVIARKTALLETMMKSVEEANESFIGERARSAIVAVAPELAPAIEEFKTLEGFATHYFSEQTNHPSWVSFTTNGSTFRLVMPSGNEESIVTGGELSISGYILDDQLIVPDPAVQIVSKKKSAKAWRMVPIAHAQQQKDIVTTTGEQKTLVILATFQNNQNLEVTKDVAQSLFNQVDAYYRSVSRGKVYFTTDIAGPYALTVNDDDPRLCNYTGVNSRVHFLEDMMTKAATRDFNLPQYQRLVFFTPQLNKAIKDKCSTANGTYGNFLHTSSQGQFFASELFFDDVPYLRSLVHEIGHNFGLIHTGLYQCDLPVDFSLYCFNTDEINNDPGGDPSSIMGQSSELINLNPIELENLGWIDSSDITEITTSGTYTVNALASNGGTRVLKIPYQYAPNKSVSQWYYVSYRARIADDRNVYAGLAKGALIQFWPYASRATPYVTKNKFGMLRPITIDVNKQNQSLDGVALERGKTFTDPTTGIAITTKIIASNYVQIAVSIPTSAAPNTGDPTTTTNDRGTNKFATPQNVICEKTYSTSIRISWSAVSNATKYRIRYHKKTSSVVRSTTTELTSKLLYSLDPRREYAFSVQAYDRDNNFESSDWTPEVVCSTR